MFYLSPEPFKTTVSSLVTYIFPQVPKIETSESSKVTPMSSEITVDPVRTAISLRIAFLLSPNEGALMAQTWTDAWSLLTIIFVSGSLSTSSAIITKGLFF